MKLRVVAVLIVAGSHVARAQEIQNDVLIRTLKLTPRPAATLQPTAEAHRGILTNLTYRTLVNITDQHVSNGLVLVLIWLTLAFIATMILYQLCKRPQFGPLTDIFLRLSSADNEVTIHWGRLRFVPGAYKIKRSKPLGRILLKGVKMRFNKKVTFAERESEHEDRLVSSRYITPRQSITVQRIIRNGAYTLTLIVTSNARTVTQVIHEKITVQDARFDTMAYSEGRLTTQWTPLIQSHAVTAAEVTEPHTRTTDTQTDAVIVPTAPPIPLNPPRTQYQGVGRGAAIWQIINKP